MKMQTVARPSRPTGGGRTVVTRGRATSNAYALGALRRARGVTQVQLADRLAVSQATVSKFEKSNPAVSTVRRYVEALGGELEIVAVFDADRMLLDY
jgi:transcriptional regulator with XRE-family HTH domain